MRKTVSCMLLAVLSMSMFMFAFNIEPIKAQTGTIYINPDGSITPSTANITTQDKVTYTFTGNNYLPIVVSRSNVTLDGRGYTLRGSGGSFGFDLWRVNNVTIRNTNVNGFLEGVSLVLSFNDCLSGNNITGNTDPGVWMWLSSSDTLAGNNVSGNGGYGVWLGSGSSNIISGNYVENNGGGMLLSGSSNNNTITGNNVTANVYYGIVLNNCSNNIVTGNVLMESSQYGAYLFRSSNRNTLIGNKIEKNADGIGLSDSSNNVVYHNNLINNTYQVSSDGSPNTWDDGYPSGGNYWSNYAGADLFSGPGQNQPGSDGIGDAPYVIGANNTDYYPLMGTFNIYPVWVPLHVPHFSVTVISNSTITGFGAGISLDTPNPEEIIFFSVTGKQGSTGFCRVSIPTAMMNGAYQVFVKGTEIPYTLLPCSNANVSYLYFTYEHSTEQIIILPEFPPAGGTYNLTIITTAGGTTAPAPTTYSYTANSTTHVTAISEANYVFDYWELDSVNVGSANPYSVYMNTDHTLKAVFSFIPPTPLSASISPLSASMITGQSLTFYISTVSGGYTPRTCQWYLNGNPISGAMNTSWTFAPVSTGTYDIYLNVTDSTNATAKSNVVQVTVTKAPSVGGVSASVSGFSFLTTWLGTVLLLATAALLKGVIAKKKRR